MTLNAKMAICPIYNATLESFVWSIMNKISMFLILKLFIFIQVSLWKWNKHFWVRKTLVSLSCIVLIRLRFKDAAVNQALLFLPGARVDWNYTYSPIKTWILKWPWLKRGACPIYNCTNESFVKPELIKIYAAKT